MVDFTVTPERAALINVDMQNLFVERYWTSAPDGLAVLDRINRLAAVCRQAGILVIHATHVLRPDLSNIGVLGEVVPQVHDGIITKGSESAALHKGLAIGPDDVLLEKPRFGAFHGTDLEMISARAESTPSSFRESQRMSAVRRRRARRRFATFGSCS